MSNRLEAKLSLSRRFRIRSCIDVVASILNEAHEGARKTRMMYRCNLSYRQLQVYLKFLLDIKLLVSVLEEGSTEIIYLTTTRGHNFLDAYGKLEELMRR